MMALMADHSLRQHSPLFYIFIDSTLLFNIIQVLQWPRPVRQNKWKHLIIVSCPFCQVGGLFLECVLRVGAEVSVLSVLGGSSQLRMVAPGVDLGMHDFACGGASAQCLKFGSCSPVSFPYVTQ